MPPFPILLAEAPRSVFVDRAKLLLLAEEPSVCFLWAREGATLFLAASDACFVVSEDALRLHVHAGSGFNSSLLIHALLLDLAPACPHEWPDALHVKDC